MLFFFGFNACVNDEALQTFCKAYSFNSLMEQLTFFKNPKSPSCIDLILTNKPLPFQIKCVKKTGLSDFHRMTISFPKMHFRDFPAKVINYRDFKKFNNKRFMLYTLSEEHIDSSKNPDKSFVICHILYSIPMHPKRKSIDEGIINLSWLKRFQNLLCKEHVLKTNF